MKQAVRALNFERCSSFAATASVVFAFARIPAYAAGASGMVGLLVHWQVSSGHDNDAELADSSYFLGFLLTFVLLASGLWSLASTGASAGGRAGGRV